MKVNNLQTLLLLSILLLLPLADSYAQNGKLPDDRQTLQAILAETRLLRQTLQKSILNASRTQVMTERLRIQTERVREVTRTLEEVKGRVVELQTEVALFTKRAKELEGIVQRESNAGLRAQEEDEHKAIQLGLESQKVREQKLSERELQLEQQLRIEQVKLDDLDNQLERITREAEYELNKVDGRGELPKVK